MKASRNPISSDLLDWIGDAYGQTIVARRFGGSLRGTWSPLAGPGADREQGYLRRVRPQSDGQRRLMEAIGRYRLTIALGPAGTGKTYLAVSAAVTAPRPARSAASC